MFKIEIEIFGHKYLYGVSHTEYRNAMDEACDIVKELKQDGINAIGRVVL